MKRALLISINPEWAEKILNGEKTIEIRTWIPKDYAGWVYVYVTKGKDILTFEYASVDNINIVDYPCGYTVVKKLRNDIYIFHDGSLNGKVAFRFWYEKVEKVTMRPIWGEWEAYGEETDFINLSKKSCLTQKEIMRYLKGKVGYAWHIDKLEIFDKPKELSEFWSDPIDFSIHTRAEALAEGYKPIQRSPQKCAWVYGGEQS